MKRKNKKKNKLYFVVMLPLFVILCILMIYFFVVRTIGKNSLDRESAKMISQMQQSYTEKALADQNIKLRQNGWINFEDKMYKYNENILTFLFMGIDKNNEVVAVEKGTDGGQADALFLLILNPNDNSLRVISINRNAMADIKLYDSNGDYLKTIEAQIAVQHGFGNGLEESCMYQVDAVRNLFYQLPIHGYCAVNMDAVIELTNLIGGIELISLEDVTSAIQDETLGDYVVSKGERIQLDGRKAYSYVRYRDVDAVGSADMRLERQQQFLGEFIQKTKKMIKKDISLPVKLFTSVRKQMVTDVNVNKVAYLASIAADYKFSQDYFYSLPGETVEGEQYEEFYIEEEQFYRLLIDLFYEPVEDNTGKNSEETVKGK